MDRLVRLSSGLVGLAVIGCVAHSAIVAGGGYGANGTPLLIALACGLAVGSMAIGVAWREGRRVIAALIAVGLVRRRGVYTAAHRGVYTAAHQRAHLGGSRAEAGANPDSGARPCPD